LGPNALLKRFITAGALSFTVLVAASNAVRAQEPTAAGLWEKTESGKPVVWVLVVERLNNIFEGAFAKMFEESEVWRLDFCTTCTDDRKKQPVLGL
jgi:hypothetical protein